MQMYEAKSLALSAAVNLAVDGIGTEKKQVAAAIAYLCGKTDRAAFVKKCAKNPLYARVLLTCETESVDFGPEGFCALHKYLFEPREQCGEYRDDELMLTGGSCLGPKLLRGSLKNILGKLAGIQGAPEVAKADFAALLCGYMRELLILSPFAYGNGVTRRTFLQLFCRSRGYTLSYASVDKKDISAAETAAFAADDPQPLFTVLVRMLNYKQEELPERAKNLPAKKPQRELSRPGAQDKRLPKPEDKDRETSGSEKQPTRAEKKRATEQSLRQLQRSLSDLTDKVNELLSSLDDDN